MALLLALVILAVLGSPVFAGEVPALEGFRVASWTGGNGITLGAVRAMVQDRDGYLWLGTDGGLYRFDGVRFTPADTLTSPSVPRLPVRALLIDGDDRLIAGLGEGGGLLVVDRERRRAERVEGTADISVTALARGPDGALWVGHEGGLLRGNGATWETPSGAGAFAGNRINHLYIVDSDLYVSTLAGLFVLPVDGRDAVRVSLEGDAPVRAIALHVDGGLWATDPTRGFRRASDQASEATGPAGRGVALLSDSRGALWLATVGQGLWQLGSKGVAGRLTLRDGLLSDGIWSLLEDREGNVWVGTHEGLNRLTRYLVTPLFDLGVTSSVARGTGGTMWAATSDGVVRLTGNAGDRPLRTLFPFAGVRTLHVTPAGRVFVAARSGLYRLESGQFIEVNSPSGESFTQVTAITCDTSGALWFADGDSGVWRATPSGMTPALPTDTSDGRVTLMRTAADGTIWIARAGGPLVSVDSRTGKTARYGHEQGFIHDAVLGAWDDEATGLWLVGSHGLSHLEDGRFVTLDRASGLPARRLLGIAGDASGGLWLAYNNGIAHLDAAEFARVVNSPGEQARVRVLGTANGLAGMPTPYDTRTADRGTDGRLWFVTGRGLTRIDPARAVLQPTPSGPLRIEAAVVDEVSMPLSEALRLPAGSRAVRVDYTALALTSPERLRFRYRLEGFDADWQDAGTRRQAFYTNLEPRDYRFRVQVARPDGTWQEAAAPWTFSVSPRFYQQPLFYLLCALALGGVFTLAWQYRLRQVRREFSLVLAERGRLSRELHDTLLQSMVGIALKVDACARASGPASDTLVDVRRDIEDSITEARRTIRNMRTGRTPSEPGDLVSAIEEAGARATLGSPVRVRLAVTGAPYRCTASVERELLRIAQEALSNAVRHGQPSQVTITLAFDPTSIALRVSDNGRGFENTTRLPNHFGLATMRERAEQLGGHFTLTTSTGGTEVEARIPVSSFT